jgi:3-hydroxybutyryl-CoA dehydratase
MEIGTSAQREYTITDAMIRAFAEASGDTNPLHLDDDYAADTQFGQRIAHGMLTASFISAVLANDLPGPGTIYLGQEVKFRAPVFLGDVVTATVELTQFREDKRIATFKTICVKQDGTTVLEGEAVVISPPL